MKILFLGEERSREEKQATTICTDPIPVRPSLGVIAPSFFLSRAQNSFFRLNKPFGPPLAYERGRRNATIYTPRRDRLFRELSPRKFPQNVNNSPADSERLAMERSRLKSLILS